MNSIFQNRYARLFLVILFSSCITFYFFGEIIQNPNGILMNGHGDYLRTCYAYTWFVRYDSNWLHFSGMNFPYGEHVVYSDLVYSIALLNKFINKIFPSFVGHEIGFLNASMIFSYFLQIPLLYLILRKYGSSFIIAFLGALAVGMMSPQIIRMSAHPGLAFVCFIPLGWFLFQVFLENPKNKLRISLLILNTLFWFFVHPYLGLILSAFYFFFWIFKFYRDYLNKTNDKQMWLKAILSFGLPIFVFFLFLKLSDHHPNRPSEIYEFIGYQSSIPYLISSNSTYPGQIILSFFPKLEYNIESLVYLGWASIGYLLWFMLMQIPIRPFKYFKNEMPNHQNYEFSFAFKSSILLLIYACGFPLMLLIGLLPKELSFLTGFRSIGRFAWPVYYTLGIAFFLLLNKNLKAFQFNFKNALKSGLLFLGLTIFLLEAFQQTKNSVRSFPITYNFLNQKKLNLPKSIVPQNYNAIIPIPFYLVGNSNFKKMPSDTSVQNSLQLSLNYQLPLFSGILTRTSNSETQNLLSIFSLNGFENKILNNLNLNNKYLIVHSLGDLNEEEISFLSKSRFLGEMDSIKYFEIDGSFGKKQSDTKIELPQRNILRKYQNEPFQFRFRSRNPIRNLFAKPEIKVIGDTDLSYCDSCEYKVSFKYFNKSDAITRIYFVVEEYNDAISQNVWIQSKDLSQFLDFQDDYSVINVKFKRQNPGTKLKFFLIDFGKSPKTGHLKDFCLDELSPK